MTEASDVRLDAWHVARDGWEDTFRDEGVGYLIATLEGQRFIAPLGSPHPPGVEVQTVWPTEENMARMRDLGRQV